MKLTNFIILSIIFASLSYTQYLPDKIAGDSVTKSNKYNDINKKAERLKQIYRDASLHPDSRSVYEHAFFDEFPNDFKTFIDLYGYDEAKDTGNILYNEAGEHILDFFKEINCIPLEEYYIKLINLSIGGYWQADGVNYLKFVLREKVNKDIKLFCKLLSKRSEKDILSLWFFYFSGHHPEKEIPKDLKVIKDFNKNIFTLMEKGLKEAQLKKNDWR